MTNALPIAQILLECLRDELTARPGPLPAERVCLRGGEVVNPDRTETEDECCPGLAWVRIAGVTAAEGFEQGSFGCINHMRTVTLELGVVRCMPTPGSRQLVSCDQWTELVIQMESDHAAMEAALCCLATDDALGGDPQIVPGEYIPRGPDGNCLGGTLLVNVTYGCACGSRGN